MGFFRRLIRSLLALAAITVIVVALGVGALRILMTRLPSYQAELERWASDSLGLALGFERMDVRFGLHGPELTFHDATVAAPDETAPFLVARRASVVLGAWALLAERELVAKRLTLDGTSVTLVRGEDGRLRLERAPAAGPAGEIALLLPPELEVAVRDGQVVYVDPAQGVRWEFRDVAVELERAVDALSLDVRAEPPASLGRRLELAADGDFGEGASGWRLAANVRGADLAVLGAVLRGPPAFPRAGHGDAAASIEWRDGTLVAGTVDAALDDVSWRPEREAEPAYEHLAVSAEWRRAGDAWRVVLNDVDVRRGGRVWAPGADSVLEIERGEGGFERVKLESGFLRLEDLSPIVAALPESSASLRWLELAPRGDLSDVDLAVDRGAGGVEYSMSARFDRVGIETAGQWPGFDGLTGELRADTGGGRVALDTRDARFDWPRVLRAALDVDELAGVVVWREGFDGIRVVSDDLTLANADARARSSLELTLPQDGGSPALDLSTTVGPFEAVAAKRYLPVHKMPRPVVEWLDGALQGGDVRSAELRFVGPIAAFPFDRGEGTFRVSAEIDDGVLEFVDGWPQAENLDGTIEFVNASFAARGSGRVLGNFGENVRVEIPDLRRAVLSVETETEGPLADVLAFLRGAPLIARHLGPGYDRVAAPSGTGRVALDLDLPLLDMSAYRLEAALEIAAGELAIDGFGPRATEIGGTLVFADGALRGEGIEAIFLDGPVTVRVSPAEASGYRAQLDVEGEVTAAAVAAAFSFPLGDRVAGQTRWRGSLLIPTQAADGDAVAPVRVGVTSNLSGLALHLPAPFEKEAGDPTGLALDFVIGSGRLDVAGNVGPTRQFALALESRQGRFELERGALSFGGDSPELPAEAGFTVLGSLPRLDFDEWADLVRGEGRTGESSLARSGIGELLTVAQLEVGDFTAFGQELGATLLGVRRSADAWEIAVDSAPVAGTIVVPRGLDRRPTIVADMQRVYLEGGRAAPVADGGRVDPRRLPGIEIRADEFAFGPRRFGSLEADVRADPLGLRLVSFESTSGVFTVSGSGGWFDGPAGPETRLAFNLRASDVAGALEALALDPIAAGEMADITASVYWPGPPTGDWMQHLGGDLSLRLETGSLLDIDPGAGRVVGLMSISALPRRLALDFRDVFNKGLVFDELTGEFVIVDGNAYTDNLKVTGPVAEIGLAGRIGLRDRDYRQQAVVTAEPGNMLPTVGGLIGGPGVGAALLIFTRIFKEPLKGIGRASYCVTGSWEQPQVERLTAEQLEQGRLCVDLPPAAAVEGLGGAAAGTSDGGPRR